MLTGNWSRVWDNLPNNTGTRLLTLRRPVFNKRAPAVSSPPSAISKPSAQSVRRVRPRNVADQAGGAFEPGAGISNDTRTRPSGDSTGGTSRAAARVGITGTSTNRVAIGRSDPSLREARWRGRGVNMFRMADVSRISRGRERNFEFRIPNSKWSSFGNIGFIEASVWQAPLRPC